LVFTSIDGLEFRGNKISELKEPIYFKSWKDEKLSPAVKVINCANINSDTNF